MWKTGWETHYIAARRSTSIQQDTAILPAKKQLRDIRWLSQESWAYALWIAMERAVNYLFARH
jgi:hypothetical protein